ncbi:aldehyde dehydrogenase family protein [Aestuariirhabdus sp. Z084]|uniref:aldehyde dehydrogenase family protein n=1 Tax=Aestuariirhabdus haliotis TaxID=2918751 RepID=UPI00201B45CC|nr:aldehyde dehydrogenase family protein [Aestuariirhabdus haliotis]MCL6415100.1 aldehyde dehydrogenase family protein [Aestuariirhabdus haliotis]MCL6419032.1 aldehyde dehydrogenase family protein [Aestuariirhabdus haliotis]
MNKLSLAGWEQRAANLTIEGRAYINGQFVDAISGETRPTFNPATGGVLADVAFCGQKDADLAVQVARDTFNSGVWSDIAPVQRQQVLLRWAYLIEEHWEELALLESLDTGKPISNTLGDDGDIHSTIRTTRWNAESIDKVYQEIHPFAEQELAIASRVPMGIVAAITPRNYPLATTAWKVAPALAAGNSVILKPAFSTPLSALRYAELARQAGLPEGVLNVLPGSGAVLGEILGLHKDIDCLTFTGSRSVAELMEDYSGRSNLKRVLNEIGGKSANVIFPDADLDKAAARQCAANYFHTGQTCTAGSRLAVHEDIHDAFVEKLKEYAKDWMPGNPLDPDTLVGPCVDHQQLEAVDHYVRLGLEEGATLELGGTPVLASEQGFYYQPTIFTGVTMDMVIAQEEIFGPVLSVIKFATVDEAIAIVNESICGLAGSVWTQSRDTAQYVTERVHAGAMNVNCYYACDNQISMPFGGVDQSERKQVDSGHIFDDYSELKKQDVIGPDY